MTYDKDRLAQICELARKTLSNWKFYTYSDYPIARYQDVDEECYFEVVIIPQFNDTFNVYVDVTITSCLRCKLVRELSGEEELIQYLKKLNKLNGLTMDAIKGELENVGFCLYINKDVVDKYVFHGNLYLKRFTGETDETSVWNTLDSEKEMIKFLEELVQNLTDMQRYMIRKGMYGD